jgi:RimJ/RimL family protein N-acetyltransferase
MDDVDTVFAWRNHPKTRRYFFNPAPISPAMHARWFESSLENPARHLLIAEFSHDKAVGVIRFDILDPDDHANLDIYLAPEHRGAGLGEQLLCAGLVWLKRYTKVRRINAEVLVDNQSSCRMFEKAGFRVESHSYKLNLDEFGP